MADVFSTLWEVLFGYFICEIEKKKDLGEGDVSILKCFLNAEILSIKEMTAAGKFHHSTLKHQQETTFKCADIFVLTKMITISSM